MTPRLAPTNTTMTPSEHKAKDRERDARIVRLFVDGYQVGTVAVTVGVTRETVERALRRAMKERT